MFGQINCTKCSWSPVPDCPLLSYNKVVFDSLFSAVFVTAISKGNGKSCGPVESVPWYVLSCIKTVSSKFKGCATCPFPCHLQYKTFYGNIPNRPLSIITREGNRQCQWFSVWSGSIVEQMYVKGCSLVVLSQHSVWALKTETALSSHCHGE